MKDNILRLGESSNAWKPALPTEHPAPSHAPGGGQAGLFFFSPPQPWAAPVAPSRCSWYHRHFVKIVLNCEIVLSFRHNHVLYIRSDRKEKSWIQNSWWFRATPSPPRGQEKDFYLYILTYFLHSLPAAWEYHDLLSYLKFILLTTRSE